MKEGDHGSTYAQQFCSCFDKCHSRLLLESKTRRSLDRLQSLLLILIENNGNDSLQAAGNSRTILVTRTFLLLFSFFFRPQIRRRKRHEKNATTAMCSTLTYVQGWVKLPAAPAIPEQLSGCKAEFFKAARKNLQTQSLHKAFLHTYSCIGGRLQLGQ